MTLYALLSTSTKTKLSALTPEETTCYHEMNNVVTLASSYRLNRFHTDDLSISLVVNNITVVTATT